MGSYPDEFPFGIMEVVELLHLRVRRQQANSVYVDCPFCGDRRGRMNVNFVKNVWRCNHCDEHGGMLALYAKLNHTTIGKLQKLCVTISKRNTHAPGTKLNGRRPVLGPRLRGPGRPLQVILLPSERLCRSRIKPARPRSIRRYPCCWPSLRCGRHIGNICVHQSADCLMNKSGRWALRVPRRPSCAALLRTG